MAPVAMDITWVVCVISCVVVVTGSPENPAEFSPEAVQDAIGNTANADSQITWADMPPDPDYATDASPVNNGALETIFVLSNHFINTVQPNDVPQDIIDDVLENNIDPMAQKDVLINYSMGILVCLGLGILFAIFMPIIGLCFCCCRLCNNCGGKMTQKKTEHENCKRVCFSATLFILTLFMAAGVTCTYLTNERLSTSVTEMQNAISTNLDDLSTYLDSTVSGIIIAGPTNFKFTAAVMIRDLENIGNLIGVPVQSQLTDEAGIGDVLNSVLAMDAEIATMGDAMIQMDNSVTALKADGQTLKDELEAVVDKINNAQGLPGCEASCKALDASVLVMDADFDNLPDISSEIDLVNEVRSKNLTALVIGGQEEFNNIPETVQDKAGSVINDTKKLLDDFTISIEDQLGSLKKIPNDVVVSIDNMKADLNDVTDLVDTYDNYRWLAGVGLTCTVLLVVVLQFCGLCFGVLGHRKKVSPTDRNCMSNSGGEMLMASVGFIFMFSWLLMLLTSISFLIGVIAEKIVCEPLTDPEFKMLNSLDGPGGSLSSDGYFLSKTLLQNGSIPLTFSGLLESCKANQAAYSAMKLGALFDLNELTDYRKMIDLEAEIDKLDVDFADIVILNADTRKQLTDFQEATQMDFQGLLDELSKDTTKANLADFADAVEQVANDGSNANPAKQKLLDAASDINDIDQGIYADVKTRQTQLETDIRSLQTSAAAIQTSVDSVLTDADTTTNFFQTQASNLTKEAALTFIKRLLSTADQYRDKALDLIEHEIGHCKPVYDLWYSLIDRSLCQYLVDSFNGFWVALGWSIVFMIPCLILSVKLAKHFRRMKYDDDLKTFSEPPKQMPPPPQNIYDTRGPPPIFASNKVGHADMH